MKKIIAYKRWSDQHYKPLGIITRDDVQYEDYVESHGVWFSGDPRLFNGVWHSSQPLFMYNDHPSSRLDYFERFANLMCRMVKVNPGLIKAMGRHP
jgi:hypothetical protein